MKNQPPIRPFRTVVSQYEVNDHDHPEQPASNLREVYNQADRPLLLVSQKSNLQSPYSIINPRLTQIHRYNRSGSNAQDAQRLGIKSGDRVRITTPATNSSPMPVGRSVQASISMISGSRTSLETESPHWDTG